MTNAEWEKSLNNSKQQTKVSEGRLEIFLSCAVSFFAPPSPPHQDPRRSASIRNAKRHPLHPNDSRRWCNFNPVEITLVYMTDGSGGGVGAAVGADLRGGLVTFLLPSPKKWAVHKWSMDAMLEFPRQKQKTEKSQAHKEHKKKKERKKPCMSSMQDSPITHFFKKQKNKKWTVCNEWMSPFVVQHTKNKRRHEMRWRHDGKLTIILPIWQRKEIIKLKKNEKVISRWLQICQESVGWIKGKTMRGTKRGTLNFQRAARCLACTVCLHTAAWSWVNFHIFSFYWGKTTILHQQRWSVKNKFGK